MEENTIVNPILKLEEELGKIKSKNFNVYFFVIDSKGATNNYLVYIYETAFQLKEMGYNVHMLHQDNEFMGVGSWMGEKYMEIPHHNIEKDKIDISISDVLFIPEFYSNVMSQTRNLPCKRVVILQNFSYMTQVIPAGASWGMYGIKDCITKTDRMRTKLNGIFPYVNTRVVPPVIDESLFNIPNESKKLIVNVVCKNETDVNNIVKPFFWKYPMYNFVAFRDLRNISREDFASCLKDAAFTVWVDTETEFGCTAVESMKCRSIVIGKVPDNELEWMYENDSFKDNVVWYFNSDDVHTLIAGAIESFLKDSINPIVYEEMSKMDDKYTLKSFIENVKDVYVNDIFKSHENEIESTLERIKNNNN